MNRIILYIILLSTTALSQDLFEASETNIGWGHITYFQHTIEYNYDGLYKFEIKAEIDTNTFLNSATLNPKLFVYEVDESGYQISEYLVQDFPIYSLYEEGVENEWLDILGMYIKIENFNPMYAYSPFQLVELEEEIFSNTLLSDIIDIKMRYKNGTDVFLQPYFDYQIEFNSYFIDYAYQTAPSQGCNDTPGGNTPLPFAITNITTNNEVKVQHLDKGIEEGSYIFNEFSIGNGCLPICNPSEICIEEECVPRTGWNNCQWERNELFNLIDTVSYNNSLFSDIIFMLKIDINLEEYYDYVGADFLYTNTWTEGATYTTDEIVYYKGMLYQATGQDFISNAPDEWFDNNEDGVNDNPWKILYPWEDGDSATIITRKKLHDGDSWLVDMSNIDNCSANLGDINGDCYLNVQDLVLIVNIILSDDGDYNIVGDLNGDGINNILDIIILANFIINP